MMNSKLIKISISLVVISLILVGGFLLWNGSLFGKALPEQARPTLTSPSVKTVATPGLQQTNPPPIPSEHTNSGQGQDVKPVCGGPAIMQILALGVDQQEQADAIRLVRIDFVDQQISVLSIPRDLWVQIPDLAEHDITEGRINASYGYGEYFNGEGGGVISFANTLYTNYNVTFDHYLVVHFDSFEKIIDQIGGVDITLDQPLDGTLQGVRFFPAGKHHLDGATAMEFVRIRFPDTDAYRVDRQTLLMQSVIAKLKDPANFTLLPGLGVSLLADQSLITDLSLSNVSKLICLAKRMDAGSVTFQSIPAEMYTGAVTSSGGNISIPSPEVAQVVQDFWNGEK